MALYHADARFKDVYPLEERIAMRKRLQSKYPDKIPAVIERAESARKTLPTLPKCKHLLSKTMTVGQLLFFLHKSLKLDHKASLMLFVNDMLPPTAEFVMHLARDNADPEDGILYIVYNTEDAYGFQ